jgi:hypothetical protein
MCIDYRRAFILKMPEGPLHFLLPLPTPRPLPTPQAARGAVSSAYGKKVDTKERKANTLFVSVSLFLYAVDVSKTLNFTMNSIYDLVSLSIVPRCLRISLDARTQIPIRSPHPAAPLLHFIAALRCIHIHLPGTFSHHLWWKISQFVGSAFQDFSTLL